MMIRPNAYHGGLWRSRSTVAVLAGTVWLGLSCASAAPPSPATTTRILDPNYGIEVQHQASVVVHFVNAPLGRAWSALTPVYGRLGIPVAASDPGRFELGNPGYPARQVGGGKLSQYLDCGRGLTATPYADEYDVTLLVETRLARSNDSTRVSTIVDGSAKPRAVSGDPVHCSSNGQLETEIVDLLTKELQIKN